MKSKGGDAVYIAAHSARIMVSMLRDEGFDPNDVLNPLGLDVVEIENPDCEITIRQEIALQRHFSAATRDRKGLWFRTGLRYGVLAYGSLGLASLCAETLGEALRLFVGSFQDLNYSLLAYRVFEDPIRGIGIETSDEDVPDDLRAFSQERSLGSVLRMFRDLAPGPPPFVAIESALPRAPDWLNEMSLDGVPISFGHPRARWYLAPGALERRLPMANPVLENTYHRLCEKLVARIESQAGLVSRVYALLLRCGREVPSIARVATELSLTERTLQRKLSESGLKFSDLVAQVREQRAKSLLRASELTVAQIAEELGFAEIGSFSHAFKRWTGKAPLDYRRAMAPVGQRPRKEHPDD